MNEQSDTMTSSPLPKPRHHRGGVFFWLLLVGICGFSYFGWSPSRIKG